MKTKIVLHADDMGKVPELLSNLGNLVRYANTHEQEQIEAVVVLNGDAIMSYLAPQTVEQIAKYQSEAMQVSFHACNNSMRSHGLQETQLPQGVQVVPAGVLDIALLQQDGFSYIKP